MSAQLLYLLTLICDGDRRQCELTEKLARATIAGMYPNYCKNEFDKCITEGRADLARLKEGR